MPGFEIGFLSAVIPSQLLIVVGSFIWKGRRKERIPQIGGGKYKSPSRAQRLATGLWHVSHGVGSEDLICSTHFHGSNIGVYKTHYNVFLKKNYFAYIVLIFIKK
jgi:hypothetical protein